jgi:tetratricopeptide (TPR) repeat protein
MAHPPQVFVSATSGDLSTVRAAIKEALLTLGCHPVEQTNFPPDYRSVREMLRDKIADCQAVIHVVGMRYGAEPDPAQLPPGTPRRSYTQMEYDLAVELDRKVYTFICPSDFPYDPGASGEDEEKRRLQEEHRQRLQSGERIYTPVADRQTLATRVRELKVELQTLREEFDRHKVRMFAAAAAVAAALLAIVGLGWWSYVRLDDAVSHSSVVTTEKIRAHLLESIEATHKRELAAADEKADWQERQRMREAAEAAHAGRLKSLDELAASFAEIEGRGEATSVFQEMTRILQEQGVDEAVAYVASQRASILDDVRARAAAAHDRNRADLAPLLQAARLYANKGQFIEAYAIHADISAVEPEWPEAIHVFFWLLSDEASAWSSLTTLAETRSQLQQAHGLAERLAALDPTNSEWQYNLAVSHRQLGNLAGAGGNFEDAETHLDQAFEIANRLATTEPANAKWQHLLSGSYSKLGDLALDRDQLDEAAANFGKSLEIDQRHAKLDPENRVWQLALITSYDRVGQAAKDQGRWKDAEQAFRRALTIAKEQADAAPEDVDRQRDLALAYAQLADALKFQGQRDEALEAYDEALDVHRKLTEIDPGNFSWQFDLWNDLEMRGNNLSYDDKWDEAEAAHAEALSIIERLTAADPDRDFWQAAMAQSHASLGDVAMARVEAAILETHLAGRRGDGATVREQMAVAEESLAVASRAYDESFEILQRLAAENPANVQWQADLADAYARLGRAAFRHNAKLDQAEQAYRQAVSRLAALTEKDSKNERWQRRLASTYTRLSLLLEQQRRWDEALECAEAALEISEAMLERDAQNPDRKFVAEEARFQVDRLRQMKAEDGKKQVESPGE